MDETPPIVIPGYELLAKVGDGGMGAVYKAYQLSLARVVAIKVLPPEFGSTPEQIERFRYEAKTEATLKHPNIVQVYEAGSADDIHYFVMEYVSGDTLVHLLERKGALPEADALAVAQAVAEALDYTWEKARIIHGDIKPANILLDEDGTVKLGDFLGLNRLGSGPGLRGDHILGTPNYMAPEQLRGEGELDCRADIYSLGAVLYHVLSGRLPFAHLNPDDIYEQHATAHLDDIQSVAPGVSDAMAWLVEKLLVRDAGQRPADWGEVRRDVARVLKKKFPAEPLPARGESAMIRGPERKMAQRIKTTTSGAPRRVVRVPGANRAQAEPAQAESPVRPRPTPRAFVAVLALGLVGLGVALFLPHGGTNPPAPPVPETPPELLPAARVPAAPIEPVAVPTPPAEPVAQAYQAVQETARSEESKASNEPATASDALQAREHLAYISLMARVLELSRAHQLPAATGLLDKWEARYPDSTRLPDMERERRHLTLAAEAPGLLEQHGETLKGMNIKADSHRDGVLKDVKEGKLNLIKFLDEGEVRVSIPVAELPDPVFLQLLTQAAPEKAATSWAAWLIGSGRFDEAAAALDEAAATGADVSELRVWLADWSGDAREVLAYRALARCRQLGARGSTDDLALALEQLRAQFGETEAVRWAKLDELPALDERLAELQQARAEAQTERQAEVETVADETPEVVVPEAAESAATRPDPVDPEEVPTDEVLRMDVPALRAGLISADRRLVRLRFQTRGAIEQITADTYSTTLIQDWVQVLAIFPEEAFKWVNSLPERGRGNPKVVYGLVDAEQNRVDLIGRRQRRIPGKKTATYTW